MSKSKTAPHIPIMVEEILNCLKDAHLECFLTEL